MKWQRSLLLFFVAVLLGGCATMPTGPTVMVMPGPGKPFEVFVADDGLCRQWAQQQIGGTSPSQTANQNLTTGAVIGTSGRGRTRCADRLYLRQRRCRCGNRCCNRSLRRNRDSKPTRPMSPSGSSRGDTTSPINSACMRRGIRSPVPWLAGTQTYAPPPPGTTSGTWVTVPGQYVNGKWVPEHRVQVPSGSGEQAAPPGPPAPR